MKLKNKPLRLGQVLCVPFIVFLILLLCGIPPANAQTPQEIAKKALAATVLLVMEDANGELLGFGSGFFVRTNLIATNFHVIEGAAQGTAKRVGEQTEYAIEGFIEIDKKHDLALLQVSGSGVQPLSLGDSDTVEIGNTVYVAGNPKRLEGTFSDGIISGIRGDSTEKRIQITAPISPGSSGGPVLNRTGEVIGVSMMTIEGGQNLNFAIPSNYLKGLLARLGPAKPLSEGKQSISAETYFLRAWVKDQFGNYKGAITDYDKVIRLKPDDANVYYNRGTANGKLGQYTAAIADYDTAIRLKPDLALAYAGRGWAKDELEQHVTAIADFDTAIRLKPDLALAYAGRGLAKFRLGQHVAAINDFDTAIRLKPDLALAYYNQGLVKADLGQYTAAIDDFDTAIRLKPDDARAYCNRGMAKANLGQHIAAINDFDTAIRLKPDYADAYVARSMVKGSFGDSKGVIADLDTAIRLKPDDAKTYIWRGMAKEIFGDSKGAIADLDTAIRLKPDFARAYVGRSLAKHNLRRTMEAKQDFQTALKLAEQAGDARLKTQIESAIRDSR